MRIKWLFEGRIGRGAYFLFSLSLGVLEAFRQQMWGDKENLSSIEFLVELVPFVVLIALTLSVHAKRFHDLGKSGYFSLLSLVPYLNILPFVYLIFKKGDPKKNKYGTPPKPLHF